MVQGRKIVVVIPAYNEECYIRDVIGTLPDFVDCIPVVDDCSTDRTAEFARSTGMIALRFCGRPATWVWGAMCLGYARLLNWERMLS